MKNKGFTLIELIAIVSLLALILSLSFPYFLNIAKRNEDNKYKSVVDDLCMAGKTYIQAENIEAVNSTMTISIRDLIDYGIVKPNISNPETGASLKNKSLIYTVNSDNSMSCRIN